MAFRRKRLSGPAIAIVAACVLAGCGAATSNSAPTTFTVPPDTPPDGPTTPPPTTAARKPDPPPPPRADLAGFSNGITLLDLGDADLGHDLDAIAATGARWLRIDLYWPTIQDAGPDSYDWTAADRVVAAAHARDLEILAVPAYSPRWARPDGTSDHHPPLDPDRYAVFVHEAAKRYAPLGVHTWEIWNEPNVADFWSPRPDPEGYAALLVRASAAIRAVDPDSTILVGGLAPAADLSNGRQIRDRTFLARVYDAGARDAFDAVALHPYSFPELPMFPADWNTFANAPALYQVMRDHGDGDKKIWGTEFGAPTGTNHRSVSAQRQAEILAEGYGAWTSWNFTGPLLWYSLRDAARAPSNLGANFGLLVNDRTPKPAYDAFVAVVEELLAEQAARGAEAANATRART